jgi:GNAT superfamily N-acetyltransferase
MNFPIRNTILFRTMDSSDIEAGLRLCRASRWNQTRRDWEQFLKLSPHGCRVAIIDNQVVGTVATVNYENRFSWIGMVLVDPAVRGHGIGTMLVEEALAVLKDTRSIRLDATPVGHRVYRQLNFFDEYNLSRMKILVPCEGLEIQGNSARPMTPEDFSSVLKFDREVFGADRRSLLEWMFAGATEYAWVMEQQGKINGYCFGRHGHNAEHLGSVIAHDQEVARQLVSACLHKNSGKNFILDATHHEREWREWLESVGFEAQRPFVRMYRGENNYPGLPEKQFGILGPEFG